MNNTDSAVHDGAFHTTHDWDSNASLTYTIVEAVAAVKGVETTDLEPILTAVDPDALEQLVSSIRASASQGGEGRVKFSYEGYQVRVTSSGDITVQ